MDIEKAQDIIEKVDGIQEPVTNNQETTNNNTTLSGREKSNATGTSNLIPLSERTKDEQRKIARQGGLKSGENRRKRKTAKELLDKMLQANLTSDQVNEILGNAESILQGDQSVYNVMLAKMVQQSMAGDTKAFIAIRDTAGEKPIEQSVTLTDTMTEADRKQIEKMRKSLQDLSKIV